MKAQKTTQRPSEYGASKTGEGDDPAADADGRAKDVQPGTAHKGESWQSRRPDPDDKDDRLNEALKDSFPASDPPQPAQPGVTGWDADDEAEKKAGGRR